MLKTANKLQKKELQQQAKRAITTHYVYESNTLKGQSRKDILDTQATVKHHVGFLRLNREHRFNMLTPNYVKNIRRSLETLNIDDNVKVIYMTGGKGEHFSNGTDFRTLLHYKKDGNHTKIAQYLEELYGLQVQTSKLNKPVIGVAPGHSFNSGASFLQSTALPTVTLDSKLCFNEVTFGFVPHGGSTYYLSRLPGEIGTFLALTGLPITGIDAKEFGIADELVHYSAVYEEEVSDILYSMEFPLSNYDLLSNKGRFDPWKQQIEQRLISEEKDFMADQFESTRQKHENIIHEEFMEPKDKIPSLSADTDRKYKQMLKKYNKRFTKEGEPGYLEHTNGIYNNYFNNILGYVKSHSGHEYPKDPRTLLLKNAAAINRCFYSNSVEEIQANLRKEEADGSSFAKLCLQRMAANSTLSMKLALKMIRDARNLDFKGALQNEINVGLNKMQDQEFDIGVSEVLMKPHQGNQFINPGFNPNVSADQVQSYFEPNKWTEAVQLELVEKAMLPTRFYYEKFSDQVRLWVNEESTPQPEVRDYFEIELKEALREQGIDIRDRALTIKSAREQMYLQEQAERRRTLFDERLQQLLKDDKMRDNYFSQARDHMDKLEKGPAQDFYNIVNKKIANIFEQAYLQKLNTIYERSQEAHGLEKRRMLIRVKKFLFQSRILTYAHEEFDRLMNILQNLPHKEPHLKEKWDGPASFREMNHPEASSSFLTHLSKAVNKGSIAPPELARSYLTNPATSKTLTLFTFDKEELNQLRADILAYPEKYEIALRSKIKEERLGDNQIMKKKKHEEYDYWFRILNEGVLPADSLPYYKQLVAYKDFVDQVEARAIDTLRLTVQRLIMDFDQHDGGVSGNNEVSQFSQSAKESKGQALRRLIALVNGTEESSKDLPSTASLIGGKQQQHHLSQSARSTKDIKKYINSLLEKDTEISQLIPKEIQGNQLVGKFREEILNDLYQLIEFVLINSVGNRAALPAKHLLQERLASLTNPTNTQQKNVTSLRILDAFLNEQNSEALIKDAIRIAKPYFFSTVLAPRLEQESRKVFDALRTEATANDVLLYYVFNQQYPEFRFAQITQRMSNMNEDRDREQYFEALYPDQSNKYSLKKYISLMGQSLNTPKNVTELESAAKTEYEGLKKIQVNAEEQEEVYHQATLKERANSMKKSFNKDNPDREVDNHQMFNAYAYDHAETEQLLKYSERFETLKSYLDQNEQELRASLQNGDWLHIYSNAITQYDLNMSSAMRQSVQTAGHEQLKQEMQNLLFGGNKSLSWEHVGEYAGFLAKLYEAGNAATVGKEAEFEQVSEYIVKQMNIVDGEELLRSQSLYEMIKHTKQSLSNVASNGQGVREEVKDFAKLQQRLSQQRKSRDTVESLASNAPRDIRDLVQNVLKSQSQYLNLHELETMLLSKDYEKLRVPGGISSILDKERLFADLRKRNNHAVQAFLKNYLSTRLDVVSLSEARETVAQAPTTNLFDERMQSQIKTVLDFVEESLKFVPHNRREAMTLGEYIQRHSYIGGNSSGQEEFMADILKRKIQDVLGSSIDVQAADMIDWEFGGVRTNPGIHAQEDARVKAALAEGKGYNPETTSEITVESHLSGRASIEIGEAALVGYVNQSTGTVEATDKATYDLEVVLRDARRLTELRPESTYMKNFFENELLQLYSSPNFDQQAVERVIQKYTDMRLKECLLNSEFSDKVRQSNNGHYYIKMLKEQITEELAISQPAKLSDFAFSKMTETPRLETDLEGRYNVADMSNLDKVGLDKLVGNQNNNTLDQLLGDYFLQKRGQYVATNELLDQLNKQFGGKTRQYADGHIAKTKDDRQVHNDAYPFNGEPNLAFAHLKQTLEKEMNPSIVSQDYTSLLELDIASAQAIQNGKNGLKLSLQKEIPSWATDIPEYFALFDVRKPAHQYVEDKLNDLLEQIFQVRYSVEKALSRNELLAYDRVLASHLTKDTLLPRLQSACDEDRNQLLQLKQVGQMREEGVHNEELQFLKTPNDQAEFNKTLKNEDALYKFLAYSGMLEKKRREDINKTRKNNELIFGVENFEEFYKGELQRDSKKEARTIDPNNYVAKRSSQVVPAFKDKAEKEADYFREFELFKENKKEQQERNQLFFVLEQFFSHSKTNPDPLNKAQEAIVDYFKDTENTFFFDKNKIQ